MTQQIIPGFSFQLALRNYAQWKDGTQSFPFSSYTLDARGYAPILEELGRGIPEEKLHLNSRVVNIDYRGGFGSFFSFDYFCFQDRTFNCGCSEEREKKWENMDKECGRICPTILILSS
jgi:hypothetical protein